jgi:outer membrane lipoprotein SlyB
MNIGGNYFVDFEFGGVRGYEAVGKIGAILGAVLGAAAGAILGVKLAGRLGK